MYLSRHQIGPFQRAQPQFVREYDEGSAVARKDGSPRPWAMKAKEAADPDPRFSDPVHQFPRSL
jgi:hypothetical protein